MSSGSSSILKATNAVKTQTAVSSAPSVVPTKKFVRTKDGRVISVQTLGSIQTGSNTIIPLSSGMPKVQIAPSTNKVIRLQTVPSNQRVILPRAPRPVVQAVTPTPAAPTNTPATIKLPNQNIQILRMPDGTIQVKGLLEGQQMIQRADGKFQLINNANVANKVTVASSNVVHVNQQQKNKQLQPVIKPAQQVVKVNGQQVLVRKDGTQIVSVGAGDALKISSGAVQPQQSTIQQVKTVMTADGTMVKTVVGVNQQPQLMQQQQQTAANAMPQNTSGVVGSPPPKVDASSSITLRVQVRMTEQGPKTIIQGLHPSIGLTKDHIRAIQQQVRTMLSQYNLKVNQLSPIMTLTLNVTQNQQPPAVAPAPQQDGGQPIAQSPQTIKNISAASVKQITPPSAIKLPTVMAINKNNATYVRTSSGALIPTSSISPQSFNSTDSQSVLNANNAKPESKSPYEMSNEFLAHAIENTLNRKDASPDVPDKLDAYGNEAGDIAPPTPLSSCNQKPVNNKRVRDGSEEGRLARSSVKRSRTSSQSGGMGDTGGSPSRQRAGDGDRKNKRSSGHGLSSLDDGKRKYASAAKLENQLSKHKELLKKDILKKRAFLEKDLQLQIHKELGQAKQHLLALEKRGLIPPSKVESSPTSSKKRKRNDSGLVSPSKTTGPTVSSAHVANNSVNNASSSPSIPSLSPQRRHASTSLNTKAMASSTKSSSKKKKSKKIVCTCRTPFDDTK